MEESLVKVQELQEENSFSDESIYNLRSWGADLSFRELITMYEEGELIKPELQRKYVWSREEASRFIESLLLNLPVPSVFIAKVSDSEKLIIDGYQRIMTVYDFVKGVFSGDGKPFTISKSERINKKWHQKTFATLEPDEQKRIRGTTIHSIIFEQIQPKNDTAMYQIFERINTSGRTLKPQEIRNCVYFGKFNKLLIQLNNRENWRKLLGLKELDSRMSDIEFVLRFFAFIDLYNNDTIKNNNKQVPLAKYLSEYMGKHRDLNNDSDFTEIFDETINTILELLGPDAFHNLDSTKKRFVSKLHPAIFDAIVVSTRKAIEKGVITNSDKNKIKVNQLALLQTPEFEQAISTRTTDVESMNTRINLASKLLYGIN